MQYESSDEALNYINEMLSIMRQHISVFDLGSILIKPVQRILKYPLLLNELIKVTYLLTCYVIIAFIIAYLSLSLRRTVP